VNVDRSKSRSAVTLLAPKSKNKRKKSERTIRKGETEGGREGGRGGRARVNIPPFERPPQEQQ